MKNKVTIYLLYTIGEIILVVFGILIALQINNWNQQQKNRELEASYYCRIKEDVEQDLNQIRELKNIVEARLVASNRMVMHLQQKEVIADSVSSNLLKSIVGITNLFRTNNAAFDDIKSSGRLNIMTDTQLKTELVNYYTTLSGIVDIAEVNSSNVMITLFDRKDFINIGWHQMSYVRRRIDTNMVDLARLDAAVYQTEGTIERLSNEGVSYLGANARISMLYDMIEEEVSKMLSKLATKCPN